MSIRRPLAVSYMLMPTLSPEFMKRTLGLPTGLKVAVVASTGLGAPIGTPFLVMNAKFTYSRPVRLAQTVLRVCPVIGFSERLSMLSAAHHWVAEQLTPGGHSAQPGG